MEEMHLNIEELHGYCINMLNDITQMCEKEGIPYYVIYGTLLGTIRHKGPIPWDPDVDLYVPNNEINRFVRAVEANYGNRYWVDFRKKGLTKKPFPRVGIIGYETELLHLDVFRMSGLPNNPVSQILLTKIGRLLWVLWKAKTIDPKKYYVSKKKVLGTYFFRIIALPFSVNNIIRLIDKLCNKYEVFSTDFVGRVMGQGAIYKKIYFTEYETRQFSDFVVRTPKHPEKLLKRMYGDYMKVPPKEYQTKMMNRTFIIKELKNKGSCV